MKNPHANFRPPTRHRDLYNEEVIPLPMSYSDPLDNLPAWIRQGTQTRPVINAKVLRTCYDLYSNKHEADTFRDFTRDYWRMVPSIDDAVARVREALAGAGKLEDTVIIFTSDNGMLMGEHGMIGKGYAYDPSIRVPLIIRDPRAKKPGLQIKQQVLNIDLAPTILDLAGIPKLSNMPGRSVAPTVHGQDSDDWRQDWLMVSHTARNSASKRPHLLATRSSRWKYIRYLADGLQEELYDLQSDPGERHNLAPAPQHAETLQRLRTRTRELMHADNMPSEWFEPFKQPARAAP